MPFEIVYDRCGLAMSGIVDTRSTRLLSSGNTDFLDHQRSFNQAFP